MAEVLGVALVVGTLVLLWWGDRRTPVASSPPFEYDVEVHAVRSDGKLVKLDRVKLSMRGGVLLWEASNRAPLTGVWTGYVLSSGGWSYRRKLTPVVTTTAGTLSISAGIGLTVEDVP